MNALTGLSTDYLNHFNEAIMLLGLAPDLPECLEELRRWTPLGYEAHFARSGLTERRRAIRAYRACDGVRRQTFDLTIAELSATLVDGIAALQREMIAGERLKASMFASECVARARELVDRAAALANGHGVHPDDRPAAAGEKSRTLADRLFG